MICGPGSTGRVKKKKIPDDGQAASVSLAVLTASCSKQGPIPAMALDHLFQSLRGERTKWGKRNSQGTGMRDARVSDVILGKQSCATFGSRPTSAPVIRRM